MRQGPGMGGYEGMGVAGGSYPGSLSIRDRFPCPLSRGRYVSRSSVQGQRLGPIHHGNGHMRPLPPYE